jgi:hypothetical protein
MTFPIVPAVTEAFGQIEQQLKIQLRAPRLQVRECFDISSRSETEQFETFCESLSFPNTVTVFLSTARLQQSVADIHSRGFRIDPKIGFRFSVGSLEINRGLTVIEVVELNIALGNSLNYQPPTAAVDCEFLRESPSVSSLRSGYHSLCVSSSPEYVIFNPAQVKSVHLVRFAGGKNLSDFDSDNLCDICFKKRATIWCVNDSAKLCATCDLESHRSARIFEQHTKIKLPADRAYIEFCPMHPGVLVEYYCPECRSPVCVNCRMNGTHARGEAAGHELISIKSAYERALDDTARGIPTIRRQREIVAEGIEENDAGLSEIIDSANQVSAQIRALAEAALKKVNDIAGEKALILRSARIDLLRRQAELDGLTTLFATAREKSGPLGFLRTQERQLVAGRIIEATGKLPKQPPSTALQLTGNLVVTEVDGPRTPPRARSRSPGLLTPGAVGSLDSPDRIPLSPGCLSGTEVQQSPELMSTLLGASSRRDEESGISIISMERLAKRKEERYLARGLEINRTPFHESGILTPEQASVLYFCFPFRTQPQTHLLFSTARDGRSIRECHRRVDHVGINVVIIKAESSIFGGFAAAKWRSDGRPFGNGKNSFLFNLTRDHLIPYRPWAEDACHLLATEDTLTFGRRDLVLAGDFDQCSSTLENSYGVGFEPDSEDAQTFLAGINRFTAQIVEIWGFFVVQTHID